MANFATVEDLGDFLDHEFLPNDRRASLALDNATNFIKVYTGQDIEVVDNRIQVFRAETCVRVLILDQIPVRAVDALTVDTVAFTDFDVDLGAGIVTRNDYLGATAWTAFEKIQVTYDSGYTVIPGALKAVCLQMAARTLAAPTSFASENIGNYGRTLARDSEGGLTTAERRVLDRFRP